MKLILGLSMLFLTFGLFGATDFRLDYQFKEEVDGWVKFHLLPATWQDAVVRCHLEGAMLASPTTRSLLSTMLEAAMFNGNPRSVKLFTGLNDKYARGSYFTLDGIPLADIPTTWANDEPDNYMNSESCLVLNPEGTMSDVRCGDVHSYMCYKKRADDMPSMTACGTTDPEYHFESDTGSCYKYHHVARHWSRAFEACAAEGGSLAIVNSEDEARLLKNIFFRDPKHTGTNKHKKMVLLGFRYNEDLGHWLTIRGETLDKAGYAIWQQGEPNNFTSPDQNGEGEYCGSMDMGKQYLGLNDLWCGYVNPFICEKDPKRIVGKSKEDYEERIRNLAEEEQKIQEEETTTGIAEDTTSTVRYPYYRIPYYAIRLAGESKKYYEERIINLPEEEQKIQEEETTTATAEDRTSTTYSQYYRIPDYTTRRAEESKENYEERINKLLEEEQTVTAEIPDSTPKYSVEFRNIEDNSDSLNLTAYRMSPPPEDIEKILNAEPRNVFQGVDDVSTTATELTERSPNQDETSVFPEDTATRRLIPGLITFTNSNDESNILDEEITNMEASSEHIHEAYTPLPYTTYRPFPVQGIAPEDIGTNF